MNKLVLFATMAGLVVWADVASAVWKITYPKDGEEVTQARTIEFKGNRDSNETGGFINVQKKNFTTGEYENLPHPTFSVNDNGANAWKRDVHWDECGDWESDEDWNEGVYKVQLYQNEDYKWEEEFSVVAFSF